MTHYRLKTDESGLRLSKPDILNGYDTGLWDYVRREAVCNCGPQVPIGAWLMENDHDELYYDPYPVKVPTYCFGCRSRVEVTVPQEIMAYYLYRDLWPELYPLMRQRGCPHYSESWRISDGVSTRQPYQYDKRYFCYMVYCVKCRHVETFYR